MKHNKVLTLTLLPGNLKFEYILEELTYMHTYIHLVIRHLLMLESTLVALSVIRIFLLAKVFLIFCIYDYQHRGAVLREEVL